MSFYWPLMRREQALLFSVDAGARGSLPSLESLPFVFLGLFLVAALIGKQRLLPSLQKPLVLVAVCLAASLANVAVLLGPSAGFWFIALPVVRSAAFALALLLLTFAWGEYFTSDPDADPLALLAVSFALSFVIPLIGALPAPGQYIIPVVAPLCSGIAWYACAHAAPRPAVRGHASWRKLPMNTVGLLVVFLLLGSLVRGVFYSSELFTSFAPVVPWLRGISLAFAAMIIAVAVLTRRRDRVFGMILTALAALFFAGLFWVAALNSVWSHIGVAAIISGRTYFGFFLFATLVIECLRRGIPVVPAFGVFAATEAVSGVLTYAGMPLAASYFGISSDEHIAAYSLFVALMLIVCCFVVFTRGPSEAAESGEHALPVPHDTPAVRQRLADEYGLTQREVEVLLLLAHGHNYKKIGQILYISPNTVLSHTKRIYKKLGVHKKQQIIDLLDTDAEAADELAPALQADRQSSPTHQA